MEFTIGGTAGVFILMLEASEPLTTNAQKHYVRWMQHYVLLEIVDCVEFLTLLFATAEGGPYAEPFPDPLRDIILAFACVNLLAPALALYRLSSRHNRHPESRNRFFLSQTLVGTVFGNLPYFIVRVYLWNYHNLVTGLFTMKNLIGIVQDTKELMAYVRDLAQGRLDGSDDSLARRNEKNERNDDNGKTRDDSEKNDDHIKEGKAAEALLNFPARPMAYIDEVWFEQRKVRCLHVCCKRRSHFFRLGREILCFVYLFSCLCIISGRSRIRSVFDVDYSNSICTNIVQGFCLNVRDLDQPHFNPVQRA